MPLERTAPAIRVCHPEPAVQDQQIEGQLLHGRHQVLRSTAGGVERQHDQAAGPERSREQLSTRWHDGRSRRRPNRHVSARFVALHLGFRPARPGWIQSSVARLRSQETVGARMSDQRLVLSAARPPRQPRAATLARTIGKCLMRASTTNTESRTLSKAAFRYRTRRAGREAQVVRRCRHPLLAPRARPLQNHTCLLTYTPKSRSGAVYQQAQYEGFPEWCLEKAMAMIVCARDAFRLSAEIGLRASAMILRRQHQRWLVKESRVTCEITRPARTSPAQSSALSF